MDSNYSSRPDKLGSGEIHDGKESILVLHNDHINTFDYVMKALVDVCRHSATQAEQCAVIAHHKGKCDILKGRYSDLKGIRYELISKGLKATIE
jgi:ATP-dependent Clp protease adaptor protein ClpS